MNRGHDACGNHSAIEEGLYEVDTINLLADIENTKLKRLSLDRADVILEWLGTFSNRQLRAYREPIEEMLKVIKHVTSDIEKYIEKYIDGHT